MILEQLTSSIYEILVRPRNKPGSNTFSPTPMPVQYRGRRQHGLQLPRGQINYRTAMLLDFKCFLSKPQLGQFGSIILVTIVYSPECLIFWVIMRQEAEPQSTFPYHDLQTAPPILGYAAICNASFISSWPTIAENG